MGGALRAVVDEYPLTVLAVELHTMFLMILICTEPIHRPVVMVLTHTVTVDFSGACARPRL
jgi:hypothetical protein